MTSPDVPAFQSLQDYLVFQVELGLWASLDPWDRQAPRMFFAGFLFPLGRINRVSRHRLSEGRTPALKEIAVPFRIPGEVRGVCSGEKTIKDLVSKDFLTVYPVGVGHSIGFQHLDGIDIGPVDRWRLSCRLR